MRRQQRRREDQQRARTNLVAGGNLALMLKTPICVIDAKAIDSGFGFSRKTEKACQ